MGDQRKTKEEELLDVFVGEWRNSGEMAPGPMGPGGPIAGTTTYHWGIGSRWLLFTSRLTLPGLGEYQVHGGVGSNPRAGTYEAYAANSLGALLVYEGEWQDASTLVFRSTHPPPAGRARIVYETMPGRTIRMSSEAMNESGVYEPYFITTMEAA